MSRATGRDGRWPREPSLYLRMLLVVPLLALLGLAVLAVAGAVAVLLAAVFGIGLYMVLFLPVGVAANVTDATDVDAWGTVEWLLAGGWLLGALGASVWFDLRRLRGWVGSLVEEARSLTDTTAALFPDTQTTRATEGRVVATVTALAQQADVPAPDVVSPRPTPPRRSRSDTDPIRRRWSSRRDSWRRSTTGNWLPSSPTNSATS